MFIAVMVLAAVAATTGWWFGQGPGSLVAIPELTGETADAAEAQLTELALEAVFTECPHLDVPVGSVVSSEPGAKVRVDRGERITLCLSTGPRTVETPDVLGLPLEDAEDKINSNDFQFGEVVEEWFSDAEAGVVLEARTAAGDPLPMTLVEQSVIDVVVSAGPLPELNGLYLQDAVDKLEQAGLTYDASFDSAEYHDDVEIDHLLGVVYTSDPVRKGDAVGFVLSLGPELITVPDVSGETIRTAIAILRDWGFDARAPWYIIDEAQDSLTASGTNPAAGEALPKGSRVDVTPRIF